MRKPGLLVMLGGLVGAGILLAVGANAGWVGATGASDTTTTVSVPTNCMPGITTAAQVAECQSEQARLSQQDASTWPTTGTAISSSQAVGDAELPSQAGASYYATSTTYGQAGTYLETGNPNISADLPVWIVTVHLATPSSSMMGASSATPSTSYSYVTVVEDAYNGAPIVSCDGCNVVQPDGTVESALSPSP